MRRQAFGDSILVADSPGTSSISYSPKRNLSTQSVFGELVLPVIGADNNVPLIHDFELRLAGRYDDYKGVGTNASYVCLNTVARYLTPEKIAEACPQAVTTIPYISTRRHSITPTDPPNCWFPPNIHYLSNIPTKKYK